MFRTILRRVGTVASTKKPTNLFSTRNFATDVESWVAIYEKMQSEAGKIAEASVGNVKSEISSLSSGINSVRSELKSEVNSVRSEISSVKSELKSEINELRSDLSSFKPEIYKQFTEVHKQANLNLRTILAGMFGVGSATVAVNQYFNTKREESSLLLTAKKPS